MKDDIIFTLGLYQPFASLMLHGKIETRMWKYNFWTRGKCLIYSTAKQYSNSELFNLCGEKIFGSIITTLAGEPTRNLTGGYALCIGDLVDYRHMEEKDEARCFVPYMYERQCLIFENVQRIEPFILDKKFRGQGIRYLDEKEMSKIKLKETSK